nr:immunoglobulin heavy chain junction region [Mus musculus]MBK4190138.1 immunoglobulin heavy chain junction region [Mus musculus]MBK4190139.1 immunoglobulin heavy chain junction region [Mus musculus]MBK4190140.1 immunoglobulin heavy chain junction region [Mus musculus]
CAREGLRDWYFDVW